MKYTDTFTSGGILSSLYLTCLPDVIYSCLLDYPFFGPRLILFVNGAKNWVFILKVKVNRTES